MDHSSIIVKAIGVAALCMLLICNTVALAFVAPVAFSPMASLQTQNPSLAAHRNADEFILADSDNRLYAEGEVQKLSNHDLNLAINEIYARRGLSFDDPELDSYFRSKSWYNPTRTFADFEAGDIFNAYEQRNIVILAAERDRRAS